MRWWCRMVLAGGVAMAAWGSRSPAWADDPGTDRVVELEPIRVSRTLTTASRFADPGITDDEYPGNATVLTGEEVEVSGSRSVPEMLSRLDGVSMMDFRGFGMGADGSVNLRGVVNSSRTNALVLVDGVRQNRLTGDEVHWQSIPVDQIDRVEVIRGGGTIYGEGALSGVINIITKGAGDRPLEFEQSASAGSYGQSSASTAVRGRQGGVGYGVDVSRRLTDGYRDSTRSRASTARGFLGVEMPSDGQVELRVLEHDDTTYFAGGITTAQAEQDRRRRGSFPGFNEEHDRSISAQWTQPVDEAWSVQSNLYWRRRESDSVTTSRFATIAPTKGAGVRLQHRKKAWQVDHRGIVGVDLLDEKASTGTRGAALSESNRTGFGLYAEETLQVWDRLTLVGGFRYDKYRYEEHLSFPAFVGTLRFQGGSPRIGATFDVTKDLAISASVSETFKAPNIDDLDAVLPPYNDNVDLKPQEAIHYEAGARWQLAPWCRVEATGFVLRIEDEILFNPFTFANANFDTRRVGAELEVGGRLGEPWEYGVTYSVVRAKFREGAFAGYVLPITPEHRATAFITYHVTPQWSVRLDGLLVSDQFRVNDFFNRLPADNYGVVDLHVRYERPSWSGFFTVQNLLNEEYVTFQSSTGTAISTGENPAPPTTWLAGVTIKL